MLQANVYQSRKCLVFDILPMCDDTKNNFVIFYEDFHKPTLNSIRRTWKLEQNYGNVCLQNRLSLSD